MINRSWLQDFRKPSTATVCARLRFLKTFLTASPRPQAKSLCVPNESELVLIPLILRRGADCGTIELTRWNALCSQFESLQTAGGRSIGFGASSRSVTLLNFVVIDVSMLAGIADDNPLKSVGLSPRTNVPIVSSRETFRVRSNAVLLLAWNFEEEMIRSSRQSREGHDAGLPLPTGASWGSGSSALRDGQDFQGRRGLAAGVFDVFALRDQGPGYR